MLALSSLAARRRRSRGVLVLLAACASGALGVSAAARGDTTPELDERLRHRLEVAAETGELVVGADRVHALASLRRFYERRRFELAWREGARPSPLARELVASIRSARAEGLDPADYHLRAIEALVEPSRDRAVGDGAAVDLDLLLTDAFLLLGSHYLSGRLNPETIDAEWFVRPRDGDLVPVLEAALAEGGLATRLAGLLPPQPAYGRLRQALAAHRALAAEGGWPAVPDGPKLERGSDGERVIALRARLLGPGDSREPAYDDALEDAVRRFQARHGLDADGVVGPRTLEALNVTADARARQIAVNMERLRWMPQDLGASHVLVNIAAFELTVRGPEREPLGMKVIVGRDYRRTPVFSQPMTHLVFSPHWEVPYSIATQDILPQIRRDTGYLSRQGIAVLQGWGATERRVDPGTVDWSRVSRASFPYRLRQSPGPKNALGRVKFMFPNRFSVYLHDTPARELFDRAERAFSSGCIRVEKPFELARELLRDDASWTEQRIRAAMESGREQTVWLAAPVPVHLLYWTAWVDADGVLHARRDIYGRDRPVAEALRERPPEPGASREDA